MAKYFKLAWEKNISKPILTDFNNDMEAKLGIDVSFASGGASAVGDFNGDGYKDILITYWGKNYNGLTTVDPSDGQMVLMYGTKRGTFADATSVLPNEGRYNSVLWTAPTVGDFNGDGVDDVILAGNWEDGRIYNMDSPPHRTQQIALMSSPNGPNVVDLNFHAWGRSSASGDFNNDGLEDFIVDASQPDAVSGHKTAIYLQKADGSFTQSWTDFGSNFFKTGDFNGDGRVDIANFVDVWGPDGPTSYGIRFTEFNSDGTVGQSKFLTTPYERVETGLNWTGAMWPITISKDQNGTEFADHGIHFGTAGDVTGDGADDIVGVHMAYNLHYNSDGVLTELGGGSRCWIDIWTMTENGFVSTDLELRGWVAPEFGVESIELIDWNMDGHLDLFIPWEYDSQGNNGGKSDTAHIYLNDGTGNFDRLSQKFIPRSNQTERLAEAIDANRDGIMDILVRPNSFSDWNKPGKFTEQLFLGTKRIFGDGSTYNPAKDGAAGFNEDYYLNHIEISSAMMKAGGFQSALEHYLAVGKGAGEFGFAAGTHVYGYRGSETIILREGNESVHAFGGDDTITGAAGADTLNGGKGADTFVYLAVTDSGTTAETRDVIEDFVSGVDRIDLSAIDANSSTELREALTFLVQDGASFTGNAGELRWYSSRSESKPARILEGDVDGDGVADFQIELTGTGVFSITDLVL